MFSLPSSALRRVSPSQTLLLNEQSRALQAAGKQIVKFGFGQSPFPPMQRAVDACAAHAGRKEYTDVKGLASLRENVAAFYGETDNIRISPDDILIAPGSKALIFNTLAAFRDADVFVPAPAWVSYAPQAELIGHAAHYVNAPRADRLRVTPAALDAAVAASRPGVQNILIINYPGNPDGLSYTAEELKALAEICRKHHILVISDEIYGLLHHQGKHVSIRQYYPEGTTITGGLSKWFGAGGWRIGVQLLPEDCDPALKATLCGVASETYSCASVAAQDGAAVAYQWDNETRDYLAHQRRILALFGGKIAEILQQGGIEVIAPEGGFYMFPAFPAFRDRFNEDSALCSHLLETTGAVLLPGNAFGVPSSDLAARLAYVDFDGTAALAASADIGLDTPLDDAFLTTFAGNMIAAAERLAEAHRC